MVLAVSGDKDLEACGDDDGVGNRLAGLIGQDIDPVTGDQIGNRRGEPSIWQHHRPSPVRQPSGEPTGATAAQALRQDDFVLGQRNEGDASDSLGYVHEPIGRHDPLGYDPAPLPSPR